MSVKAPGRNKAAVTKTNTKRQSYRGPDGKTNIDRYNDLLKCEKIVHKTVKEWAEIVKSREDALQARNRAETSLSAQCQRTLGYQADIGKLHQELETSLSAQCQRTLGYQADIGKLHQELWRKRSGSFCFGAGLAFLISYLLIHFV